MPLREHGGLLWDRYFEKLEAKQRDSCDRGEAS